ncbi:hypothetical protein N234_31610 [Ralstonia pickettii DTP0602]|nr:hypothetical protein N234_31610 [Ralstonia pickettii DTP0602]
MAQAVVTEGSKAGRAVSSIGDGGQQSAQKTEAATRSMVQSIQRATAAMEAGSKSSSQYYEALANQRGVNVEALKPYLAQLEAVEARQKQASVALNSGAASMDKMGVSAKQTAAAMRGVPAQLTDIFVSLQGGQQPMTVLLQQGGQLKDMFGGIAPAARALGSALVGMLNPLTLGAAAVGALYLAYRAGASEGEEFRKTLIMTGSAIGQNADQLQAMSARIGAVVGTQRQAAEAVNEFAKSAKVGAGNLEQFATAAVRWQDATGTAAGETVKQFEALAKSPLEASLKLNESMNYLTESIYKQIKALQDAGKETEAAALAQKAYADALDSRAPQMVANLGTVETAWKKIKEASAGALDWTLNIGRSATPESRLKELQAEYERLSQSASSAHKDRATAVLAQIVGLQDLAKWQNAVALNDAENAKAAARAAAVDAYTGDKSRKTRAQQMQDDLAREKGVYDARKADAAGNAKALLDIENSYQTAVANIRDKYKDKKAGAGGVSATDTELAGLRGRVEAERQLSKLLESSGGAVAKLNDGEKLSLQYSEKLALAKNAETRARLTSLKALADELGAQQRSNADVQEFAKQQQQYTDAQIKLVESIQSKAAAMELENSVYGLGKDEVERMTIARLEEHKAVLQGFEGSGEQIKLLEQEIDARKRLMEATSQREALDANKKAADQAAADWKKSTDQVEQALANALMDGGKSGKEYVEGLFRTMILRPIISAVVNPIAGAVSSALGLSGGTSGGGFNAVQAGQQANSLYGLYNNAGAYYNYAVNSLFGTGISSATGATFGGAGALASGAFGAGAGASIYGGGVASAAYGANAGLSLYGTGTALSLSGGTAGLGATAGSAGAAGAAGGAGMTGALAAVPVAGWIAMGMAAADSLYGKGWDYQKVDMNTFGKIYGSATFGADRLLRGIGMSDRLANALSGASTITALFGRKKPEVQSAGIEGDFTADGFDGQNFVDWKAKGGWFRSDKRGTNRSALDDEQSSMLQGAVRGSLGFYRNLDDLAGGAGMAGREDSFSYHVRADLRGEGSFEKLLTDLSNAMGSHMLPQLKNFRREGESIADTAQRLTGVFSVTNTAAEVLGKTTKEAFGGIGLSTSRVRQQLIDVAGGLEAFSGKVSTYYDIYFSQEEKLTRLRSQLSDSFDDLGVAMPTTMEGFRSLVESLDLTTESGQEMFSSLLDLAPAFAQASQAMSAFAKQVADFQESLRLGDLSTLTPEQKYAEAKRQYDAASAAALSGDSDAQAQWAQIAQAFLEASRSFFASGGQYATDFAAVQGFRPNGSHANGLAYVPFDGYVAELHQGERVLTREENASYSGPDWSKYGRSENVALVAEIRSLTAQVASLRETVRQVEQAKEAQAEARHAEAQAMQAKQIRLQQQLVDK